MLNKPDVKVVYEDGKAVGVESEGETAKAKMVIGDPSYFPGKQDSALPLVSVFISVHFLFGCSLCPDDDVSTLIYQT
jgi:GDP dissociation inhibitor